MDTKLYTTRLPLNDLGIEDEQLLKEFNKQIDTQNYSSAATLLNRNNIDDKGMRAIIFNTIKQSILALEIWLLNLNAGSETIYSLSEPSTKKTEYKMYWVQPILGENEMSVLGDILKCIKYIKREDGWQKISEWTLAENIECGDGKSVETKISDLTQDISKIKVVLSLPEEAKDNPDTLYLVVEGGGE